MVQCRDVRRRLRARVRSRNALESRLRDDPRRAFSPRPSHRADISVTIRILCLSAYYLSGYKAGGVPRSVAGLTDFLGEDFELSIITSDRDLGDREPYGDVRADCWQTVGNARVHYCSPGRRGWRDLVMLINATAHDVLYLNGVFESRFSVLPALARRLGRIPRTGYVIAPRGQLAPAALDLKRLKKSLFLALARALDLYRGALWHATSQLEADQLRRRREIGERVLVAPNLPGRRVAAGSGASAAAQAGDATPLSVCFLSRIAPIKNLDFALRVLAQVRAPVQFDIYGPIEDEAHWRSCVALMQEVHAPVRVRYLGSVPHDHVPEIFAMYDLFLFPTRSENFGHVIIESLLAGTPVLLSDQSPWSGLERAGAGWNERRGDLQGFARRIEELAGSAHEQRLAHRRAARAHGLEWMRRSDGLQASRSLFARAARRAERG
jgi:glycosyltransferase involved in cell wall biosynthesis